MSEEKREPASPPGIFEGSAGLRQGRSMTMRD